MTELELQYLQSTELLQALVRNPAALIAAMRDPTMSANTLELLAQHPILDVRVEVARHPNTPAHMLVNLMASQNEIVMCVIAERSDTPSEILARLAVIGDTQVRYRVARHENTPIETLMTLAEDERYVAEDVPLNKNATSEILAKCVTQAGFDDKTDYIRIRVAKHPNTSFETRVYLYQNDPNEDVRQKCLERLDLLDLIK